VLRCSHVIQVQREIYESSNQQEACLCLVLVREKLQAASACRVTKPQLITYLSKDFPIYKPVLTSSPAEIQSEHKSGRYMAVGRWSLCRSQVVASRSNRLGGGGHNDPQCDAFVLNLPHRNTTDISEIAYNMLL
jgi:hypothetical protein